MPTHPNRFRLRNDARNYGLIAITLHWVVALAVIGMFALGVWMTGLGYYDPWYRQGPALHKSVGVLILLLMLLRLARRLLDPPPPAEPGASALEQRLALLAHQAMYLLLFAIAISGYLISTADGRGIAVFGLFEIPALFSGFDRQEDIAGAVHWYLALGLIGLAALHALAALKHHFIDRDRTLKRMLGIRD